MSSAVLSESRSAERVPVELEVSMYSDHNFYTGFVKNVSSGGVFFASSNILPVGSVVDIVLSLSPGKQKVPVKAEVRWIRQCHEYTPEAPPGMGMRFLNLDPRVASKINQFIENRRDALFFDED